jgi:hypothetical protein
MNGKYLRISKGVGTYSFKSVITFGVILKGQMKDLNIANSATSQIRTRYVRNRSLLTLRNNTVPSSRLSRQNPQVDMKKFEVLSSVGDALSRIFLFSSSHHSKCWSDDVKEATIVKFSLQFSSSLLITILLFVNISST